MKPATWLMIGALLGAAGVALGAFGAHGLNTLLANQSLDAEALAKRHEWFDTAVRYHFLHAIALSLVGIVGSRAPGTAIQASGWLFLAGIAIFSGLLYVMTFTGIKILGAIVPIGGLALLGGWIALALAARNYE